jgi:hypothetical protein
MYRILSVSRNTSLLLRRNDALAMAGFSVVSPKSPEEAPFLALQRTVDAVVIGHSVGSMERQPLIEAVRRVCPGCLVVFVYIGPEKHEEPLADVCLDLTHGAESLISELQQRLPRLENPAA